MSMEMPKMSLEDAQEEASKLTGKIEKGEASNYSEAEKRVEREKGIKEIQAKIEEMRKKGLLNNEAANLTSYSLELEGNDALLANRLISRGSDPASLELALKGEISEPTMRAHRNGPGCLKEDERKEWLILASKSQDEYNTGEMSVLDKFKQFDKALEWLKKASPEEKDLAANEELQKILNMPYGQESVRGVSMRVYPTDSFASAYWVGEEVAATRDGKLLFVGSQGRSLEEIGVKVDKQISPNFGIIFE